MTKKKTPQRSSYKKKYQEAVAENERLQEIITAQSQKFIELGAHLMDQPFIPEYLGFEETQHEDYEGSPVTRIYSKDGFSIAKLRQDLENTDPRQERRWAITESEGAEPAYVYIDSMYHAIIVLNAHGMDVHVQVNDPLQELMDSMPEKPCEYCGVMTKGIDDAGKQCCDDCYTKNKEEDEVDA